CDDAKPDPNPRSTVTQAEVGENDNHGGADGG
ncbi:hypothetical protein A2U01_0078834, partial [Trifolium medium]|nr:hypothetical protein [Trifolium medium]